MAATPSLTRLDTPRLVLRPFELTDFAAYIDLWRDQDATRYVGGPRKEEDAWLRFTANAGCWTLHGLGFFSLIDKATGAWAGQAGFMRNRRGLAPDITDRVEAGWLVAPAFQGRGLASEALSAAFAWMDANLGAPSACIIHPANIPSLRLAARFGFLEAGRTFYHGEPTVVFLRPPALPGAPDAH